MPHGSYNKHVNGSSILNLIDYTTYCDCFGDGGLGLASQMKWNEHFI